MEKRTGDDFEKLIDHQLELYQHYREQALAVLRITLSFIGIILTAGLVFSNSASLPNVGNVVDFATGIISPLSDDITGVGLNKEQGAYIVKSLYLTVSTLLIIGFVMLFIFPSIFVLMILEPSVFEDTDDRRVVSDHSISRIDDEYSFESSKMVAEYNEEIISNIESLFQSCFSSLKFGFYNIGVAFGLAIPTFILRNGVSAFTIFIITVVAAAAVGIKRVDTEIPGVLLKSDWIFDLSQVLFIISAFSLILSIEFPNWIIDNILITGIVLSAVGTPFIMMIAGATVSEESFEKLLNRNGLVMSIGFLGYLLWDFLSVGQSTGIHVLIHNVIETLILLTFSTTVFLMFGRVTIELLIYVVSILKEYVPIEMSTKFEKVEKNLRSQKSRELSYEYQKSGD